MGEVWRARDSKLGREVAIKTLPEEFAKDEERLARFEREAKLLASLNHPSIATIHGLEEDSGTRFLVLELVEGDTLADRLKRGSIPVEESLKLALQIAEALEAAHEKGVIHRDLKPANIKVTPEGKIKVLDFGLAKALTGAGADVNLSNSPTLSMQATQQGVILGTAAYMSPEQARGESTDRRADVWAFGCVLYEMLTGRGTFDGRTVSDVLAGVLRADPNWSSLPGSLHPRIRLLLERCLEKEARDRYHDIADPRVDIQRVLADPDEGAVGPVAEVVQAPPRSMLGWIALAVVVSGLAAWNLKPDSGSQPPQVGRFAHQLPEGQSFTRTGGSVVAVSPDGSRIVYVANGQLFMKATDTLEASPIPGTDEDPSTPFFSPDGEWIGFRSGTDQQLKKISVSGGTPVMLSGALFTQGMPSWGEDDAIVFGQGGTPGVLRVSANGGEPEVVATGRNLSSPQMLPDGRTLLFTRDDVDEIVIQSLDSDEGTVLFQGENARYVPTGHIVYGIDDVLLAVPFDVESLEVRGGPVALVEGLSDNRNYAVSDSGTLVYVPGDALVGAPRNVVLVDREGRQEPLNLPAAQYVSPRLSPDGTTLAIQSEDDADAIWTYDLTDEGQIQQLTFDGVNYRPIWTPDGERITFASDRDDNGAMSLYWQRADGSGTAERLTTAEEGTAHWPGSWSPDGQVLSYMIQRGGPLGQDWEIWTLSRVDGEYQSEPLYDVDERVYLSPEFSPDGRWLAYASGPRPGDQDIYVEPFPPTGRRERISREGGYWTFWSPAGDELFYRSLYSVVGNRLRSVDIETEPDFRFRNPQLLAPEGFSSVAYYRDYDITPDGERFVMIFPAGGTADNLSINIVQNWFEELKQRVPVP